MNDNLQLPRFLESPHDGDLNSHTPWSEWDVRDLEYAVEHHLSIADTANFLCRTQHEVRHKAKALGLVFE